jgi:hypothetical protein
MQAEILAANPASAQRLLGVNQTGYEAGNASVTAGRTIPWLQDTAAVNAWSSWAVTFRDVVILDALNRKVFVYNLTVHDLGNPTDYAQLKGILRVAAGE